MLFNIYQDEVKRRLTRDIDSGTIDVYVKRWINSAVRTVSSEARWKDLRGIQTVPTVAGQEDYVLPYDFGQIAFVYHRFLGYNHKVSPIPERLYVGQAFIGTTQGTPHWYRTWSANNMLAQPTAASVITVVSSASTGDNAQKVLVEGLVGGYPDREEIALNNDTPVAGTKVFTEVHKVSKSASTIGRISLSADTGSTLVGVLPAGLSSNSLRRKWIKYYYIPDVTDESIYNHYYRKILDMAHDNDSPWLGEDFDEVIILKACQIGMGFEEGLWRAAKQIRDDYKDEIRKLKNLNNQDDDWLPLINSFKESAGMGRVLNFGPYYPITRL